MPPRPALITSPGTSTWVLARLGAACGTIPAASLGLSFLTLAILPPPVHLPAGAATTAAEWTCAAVIGCQLIAVCFSTLRFYLMAAGTPQPLDGCHPRIRLAAVTPSLSFSHVCPWCRATETGYCVNAACFLTMNVCILRGRVPLHACRENIEKNHHAHLWLAAALMLLHPQCLS